MRDHGELVALLKERFIAWRTPPVELPAESVIAEVVDAIWEAGRKSNASDHDEAMDIVRRLAGFDAYLSPRGTPNGTPCPFCIAGAGERHAGDWCLVLRARRLIEAEKGGGDVKTMLLLANFVTTLKFTDEQLSRVLSTHEEKKLCNWGYDWRQHDNGRVSLLQAAFVVSSPASAHNILPDLDRWFTYEYNHRWTAEQLLIQIENRCEIIRRQRQRDKRRVAKKGAET